MIHLRHCTVEFTPEGATTRFPDGTSVDATPHPDDHHYSVVAHRLGYGDDILAYCQEHEVCHSLAAQWFWDEPSHVLWSLAHKQQVHRGKGIYEEMAAQTLQAWLRANVRPILSGADWSALKRDALELLA